MFDVVFRLAVMPTLMLVASVSLARELRLLWRDMKACV